MLFKCVVRKAIDDRCLRDLDCNDKSVGDRRKYVYPIYDKERLSTYPQHEAHPIPVPNLPHC